MQYPEWDLGFATKKVIKNPLVFRHLGIILELETMAYGCIFTRYLPHCQELS